jgi:ankyrin repeat protein
MKNKLVAMFLLMSVLLLPTSIYADNIKSLGKAVSQGKLEKARSLLKKGVSPNVADGFGDLPLYSAVRNGNLECVKLLLEYGANPGLVLRHVCSEKANALEITKALLEAGADPNTKDDDGITLLICLLWLKPSPDVALQISELLISHGADVNAKSAEGNTALTGACARKGYDDVVKLLLSKGANPNTLMKNGWSPLDCVCSGGELETARSLIEHGADVNLAMEPGDTPLILAAMKGHLDVVRLLLENGADPKRRGEEGYTVLQAAAFSGNKELAAFLVTHAGLESEYEALQTPVNLRLINEEISEIIFLCFNRLGVDEAPVLVTIPPGAERVISLEKGNYELLFAKEIRVLAMPKSVKSSPEAFPFATYTQSTTTVGRGSIGKILIAQDEAWKIRVSRQSKDDSYLLRTITVDGIDRIFSKPEPVMLFANGDIFAPLCK